MTPFQVGTKYESKPKWNHMHSLKVGSSLVSPMYTYKQHKRLYLTLHYPSPLNLDLSHRCGIRTAKCLLKQ